jgi:DNA-binding MarR family transcriptional regulator/GNAT superfamily N-acetyltransferase
MPTTTRSGSDQVAAVRQFNRFYTRQIGVLRRSFLDSPFSLTEVRVLYELAHREHPSATEIARELGLDPGYLSRLLRSFRRKGLVRRTTSRRDARQSELSLTSRGSAEFARLEKRQRDEVARMLRGVAPADRARMVASLRTTQRLLGDAAQRGEITLRPHRPGDMGWITHRQAVLYHQEYGWDQRYEALIARIMADFVENFDPVREHCWVAEREGEIVGSVFCVRKSATVAKLRLLYVEPSARGHGLGTRLVRECIAFARRAGYRKMILWTNSVLTDARRIYERTAWRLVAEDEHMSFGKHLRGQTWELKLGGSAAVSS